MLRIAEIESQKMSLFALSFHPHNKMDATMNRLPINDRIDVVIRTANTIVHSWTERAYTIVQFR